MDVTLPPAQDRLERMFARLGQRQAGGLGMGFAISRSIVAAHVGRMWATRIDGGGLTLRIQLPVTADVAVAKSGPMCVKQPCRAGSQFQ